ncbi:hypothetical protein GCM10025331_16540 [Actinoplanes utahensis]|nr:hypothetical protein Aut01nite_23740 [Actinoplanes utahensis]
MLAIPPGPRIPQRTFCPVMIDTVSSGEPSADLSVGIPRSLPTSRRPPAASRGLPPTSRGLPPTSRGLPPTCQRPPAAPRSLSAASRGLSRTAGRIPRGRYRIAAAAPGGTIDR